LSISKYQTNSPLVKTFPNLLLEKLFVIEVNLIRRHLNQVQKVFLSLEKKQILQQLARQNMSLGGKGVQICTPLGRINDQLAKDTGISARQFSKIEYLLSKASEATRNCLLTNPHPPVNKAYNKMKIEEARQKTISDLASMEANLDTPQLYQLIEGDFRQVGFNSHFVKAESVDLMFTDPLYYESSLYLFKDLGKLADRILRPGGSFIIYLVPQSKEPELYNYVLQNSNLKYWDRFILRLQGPIWSNFNTHIKHRTKTLAWFCKGDKPVNPLFDNHQNLFDIIESEIPDKTCSHYTQSPVEAEYLIEALTSVNDLVLDPMLGEGTTGKAAIKLRRRFIGIEIDPATLKLAKAKFCGI
jgi:DNA modification methylase